MIYNRQSLLLGLIATLSVAACGHRATTPETDLPTIDFADGFQQSDADAILRECGADDIELNVSFSGEITFEPSLTSDYDASVCVLEYIKESGTTKFGFVGNERYVTPKEDQ